jgi:hypothetical protein
MSMIKFIRKEHVTKSEDSKKLVIYYNTTDIFLGATLMILVVFFIHDYLSHAFGPKNPVTSFRSLHSGIPFPAESAK